MDKDFIKAYEDELAYKKLMNTRYSEGIDKGIEQGIKQGIEQGIEQNKKDTVINMLNENLDIELIKKVTGLTLENIDEIKEELSN